jgi:hypothetical protein
MRHHTLIALLVLASCSSKKSAPPAPTVRPTTTTAKPVEMKPDECPKQLDCDKLFPPALRDGLLKGMKIEYDAERVECSVDDPSRQSGALDVRVMPGPVAIINEGDWVAEAKKAGVTPLEGVGRYATVIGAGKINNIFMLPSKLDCTLRVTWEKDLAKGTQLARAVDGTIVAAAGK